MGFKKVLFPFNLFTAQAVTGANTYTSPSVNIQNLDNINVKVSWTGTIAGVLSVLQSQDDITYSALANPTWPNLVSGDGTFQMNLQQLSGIYLKLKYVNASGTGTLSASVAGKDLN